MSRDTPPDPRAPTARPAPHTLTVAPADASEGDVNLSHRRRAWQDAHLDEATRALLAEDARWFFHQSMSTPCLNALQAAEGAWLTDLDRKSTRLNSSHNSESRMPSSA
jgi:hypothetical protein